MAIITPERVYPYLPVFLQNAACCYVGLQEGRIRFGKEFRRRLKELQDSQKWTPSEIEAYQDEKLRELVRHAYDNVPFYRDSMKRHGLTPDDVRRRDDLPKMPVLTKEDVRFNLDRLLSETARKRDLVLRHTSGTTGKSLSFYCSRAGIAFQWAVWWRHRQRFGLEPGDWHANFTGKLVVPPGQRRPPYWRWNLPFRQALLNMQHITAEKTPAIVSFLNRHRFRFYSGYPSILHAFALVAREAGLSLESPPQVIVTGAENVLDFQRRDLSAFTGAVLTDQYGASEGCGNASHCREFVYHEDFEFGILESENPVTGPDGRQRGEILCTGFANPEFPFIRYRIGDTGAWESPSVKCRCGLESRVLVDVEGRTEDYVVTPEGTRIMRFDYLFKDTHEVAECQVVQERPGEIKLRIVRRPSYSTRDEDLIRREVRRWISPRLATVFEYVDEIEREPNGKFRAVKSLLKAPAQPAAARPPSRGDLGPGSA